MKVYDIVHRTALRPCSTHHMTPTSLVVCDRFQGVKLVGGHSGGAGRPEGLCIDLSQQTYIAQQTYVEYLHVSCCVQVYVKGELLGGCDIVLEMEAAGELKTNVEEMMHRMADPE